MHRRLRISYLPQIFILAMLPFGTLIGADEPPLTPKPSLPQTKLQYQSIHKMTPGGMLNFEIMRSQTINYHLPKDGYWKLKDKTSASAEFVCSSDEDIHYTVNIYKNSSFIADIELANLLGYINWLNHDAIANKTELVLLNEDTNFRPKGATRSLRRRDGSVLEVPAPGLNQTPFNRPQALIEYKIQQIDNAGTVTQETGYLESITPFEDFMFFATLEAPIAKFEQAKGIFIQTTNKLQTVSDISRIDSIK